MNYLPVRGGKLYYETAGEGPPLVLIHAGFLDSRMWDDQFQLFSKDARGIRYGRSSQSVSPVKSIGSVNSLLVELASGHRLQGLP